MTPAFVEWWFCGECCHVAEPREWGGTSTTAVCPNCDYEHRDDESSWVEAGTEIAMRRRRHEEMATR